MDNDTGRRIFEARIRANMSMEELGKRIGEKKDVHKSTIKRYECGEIENIPMKKIKKIAEALGVDAMWLFSGESAEYAYVDADGLTREEIKKTNEYIQFLRLQRSERV